MANVSKTSTSSIGMAFAGKSASVDIPKPIGAGGWKGKDTSATVATRTGKGKGHQAGLPTPPNSISPTLPPQNIKYRVDSEPLTPPHHGPDSDIDLQEAIEHAATQDQASRGYGLANNKISDNLDSTGNITPTLLATHHLPDILLEHGPLAIRHIMGYLTTSVPGFSGIPAPKARRLVVAALEGRGGTNGEAAGGVEGDVIFEKIGWGRWDARRRGQPSQRSRHTSPVAARHAASLRSPSPYTHSHSQTFHIPHRPRHPRNRMPSSTSLSLSNRSRELETEADRMSMGEDSEGEASCSDVPEEPYPDDDMGEATDEEDWAGIGAAALRAGFSFPKGAQSGVKPKPKVDYNARVRWDSTKKVGGGPANSALAKSAPGLTDVEMKDLMQGVGKDEGEAIKALLQLGSM
jgi:hypothetical protein